MSSVTPPLQLNNDRPLPCLVIRGEGDHMLWLEYLPDGRRVVTGSLCGTVRVWSLESGEQEGTPMKHECGMRDFAVTRDGTKIISSDDDGRIKVWDVESHKLVKEWTHPESEPIIAISPDDQFIAVGSWNVTFYPMEGNWVNHSIEVGHLIWCMCFSPDGKKLACATECGIRVYGFASGRLILGPADRFVTSSTVLWSHDSSRLFSGSSLSWKPGIIRCWNSDTEQEIGHPWTGHTRGIASLFLSPDGSILASASEDRTVRLWNAITGDPVGQHLQHDEQVRTIRFSPSGESMASAGRGGNFCVWRAPWLNSVEGRISPADLNPPHNTVHSTQVSPFRVYPPPPYSTHIPGIENASGSDLGSFTIPEPITSSVVPSPHPSPPILSSNSDENDSLETSTMSDQVDLQYILPDPSLGLAECQRIFALRLRQLLDLATSKGLHAPHDLIHSSLPQTELANVVELRQNPMCATDSTEPSTPVFRSTFNADSKKTRKIDKIKQKLIAMLREIGFRVPKDRLPWSTLEGELEKRGYTILHWPQGVLREKDKGVYSLGAEEADKLYRALFVDVGRVQFVRRDDENGEGTVSLPETARSDDPFESHRSCVPLTGKQPRFRVMTQESYSVERPQKRPQHV